MKLKDKILKQLKLTAIINNNLPDSLFVDQHHQS